MSAVMTVPELAEALRVAPSTVYRLIASGDIPCLRIGRTIRVPRKYLEARLADPVGEMPSAVPPAAGGAL